MLAFLKRSLLVILGLLLLVVVVWFAGPLFAFASYRPLESATARLIVIALIVGGWLVVRLVKRLRAAKATDTLLAAVVAQPPPAGDKLSADAVKLRERFEEAVGTLKTDRSGQSLYERPWYVIIGAPGSGKTTALLNSGLKFPLEQRVGKGALRGVGGTRNCDWWFTDEAVFLDTAGRYTTQDSDISSDSAGWTEFLGLLKTYRPRRPINGVILTISAQDLVAQGHEAREAHIDAARRRLDELTRELGVQLPVYLMVTKCDLVAGFAEYFDDLNAEARAQVWGVTFEYDQTLQNEGPRLFAGEFDALMTRLNERVLTRVQAVTNPRRRTRVFAFPQQMAATRDALTGFVNAVFGAKFEGQILLRGVYLTSGTQEGTPFDRLLGSISRRFGAADAVAAPSGPGKAYFVEHLLKGVMLGESGLAGVNRRLEARKALLQLAAYAAAGLVMAAGVALLSISYTGNSRYLTATAKEVQAFEAVPEVTTATPLDRTVPRLDAIRAVVDSSEAYRQNTSFVLRWGLYQGSSVGNSARDAYQRELDGILLPRVEALLRARLRQYASDPEKLYLYLKGYLMLGDPAHLDKSHLEMLTNLEWNQATGPSSAAGQSLARHFRALLDQGDSLRPLALDATVVSQARATVRQTSMPAILYYGIKREYADGSKQGPRLDQLVGLDAEQVFTRKSGAPLSAALPALFTPAAFKAVTSDRTELVNYLKDDAWVLGDNPASALASAGALASGVTNLYELEYIREWDALLDDLQFASFKTVSQTNDALKVLTAPASPLRGLLRVVADHTTLVEPQGAAQPRGVIEEAKRNLTDRLSQAVKPLQNAAGMATVAPGTLVTVHFQWVRQLTAGEAGQTPIDRVITSIAAIQQQLSTLGPDVAGADPVQILSSPTFRGLTQNLREQAAALPPGLRTLVGQIGRAAEGSVTADATSQIEQMYAQEVLPACQAVITGRFPFAAASPSDVQLADLGEVFGYGGVFDKFFADNLANMVDATQAKWSWREGAVQASPRLLDQFQAALRIRELFFAPGSKVPKVDYFLTPRDLDREATRFVLELDGVLIEDRHGAPVRRPLVWPGATPGGSVVASFEARFYDNPKRFGGPWALFRFIDATLDGTPDAQQALPLRFRDQYHSIRLTLEGARAGFNPFAYTGWRQFACQP